MFLSNVRSLCNKTDEFLCNLQTNRHYKDDSVFSFTETWLEATIPDSVVQPPGLTIYRSDHSCDETGKASGRGVCILVKWSLGYRCQDSVRNMLCWHRNFHNYMSAFLLASCPGSSSSIIMTALYIPLKLTLVPLWFKCLTSSRRQNVLIQTRSLLVRSPDRYTLHRLK